MTQTKLQALSAYGQSMWLDYISRPLLETGKLNHLIEMGLRGMTSNPSIFNQSISQSQDYDGKIIQLKEAGKSTFGIYDELTIRDVGEAADIFKPVYDSTQGLDGYVSLEINPQLAMNTEASIREGIRLAEKVKRPNVMIKVPSTPAGFPVIEELLSRGIPVNVTLIFSLQQYKETARAFLTGIKRLGKRQKDLSQIRSVASVFVSRIDTAIDERLDEKIAKTADAVLKEKFSSWKGQAAVANSRLVFEHFKTWTQETDFKVLAKAGAAEQRVLWASTGTKNPRYSDLKYVTELISRPTVNTAPEKTLNAFLDHGAIAEALQGPVKDAAALFKALKDQGIDIDAVCAQLLKEGVAAFEKSFEELLASIERKARHLAAKS